MVSGSIGALDELDALLGDIQQKTASAREVCMKGVDADACRPAVTNIINILDTCGKSIQAALDRCYRILDTNNTPVGGPMEETSLLGDSMTPMQLEDTTMDVPEAAPTYTVAPPRLLRANAGVYDMEDDEESPKPKKAQSYPSQLSLETVNHLLFVIHGIGEHGDFKDGQWDDDTWTENGGGGKNRLFRELFRSTRDTYFSSYVHAHPSHCDLTSEVPLALEIQSIEWHEQLHATGVDAVFDRISPDGSHKLRHFNKTAFMDLLYYAAPTFGQLVLDSVASQMNTKFARFVVQHPGWNGKISIFAHSLGSVIAFDLLTHADSTTPASSHPSVTFPSLDFAVENLFCAGSPAPLMVLSRGEVQLDTHGAFVPGISLPKCARYFNFIHPSDPIAYRVEPLLYDDILPAVHLPSVDTHKSFADIAALVAASSDNRIDYLVRRRDAGGAMMELAYAPSSHKSYWTSPELVLFALVQICRPVIDKLALYDAAMLPRPTLSPRRVVAFTPHKKVTKATSVVVRDGTTGSWHPRVVLLANQHLYCVRAAKDIAVGQSWSIPLTQAVSVATVDASALQLKDDNASGGSTILLKAETPRLRDEWVAAIQQRLAEATSRPSRTGTAVDVDGLGIGPSSSSSSSLSIEYFGAVKTGMLTQGWSTKWIVLTKTHIRGFDACPTVETWAQFSITTVFVSRALKRFRLVSPDGTSFTFKVLSHETFQRWEEAVRGRKRCVMLVEDDGGAGTQS
ncbi:Aste57867_16767 [Aphanomyces stellatus]|uniref:Aste57867_16767 protein n=1 Tax=Aphanomyces stellatus TaxID=120398 RepID=A0A485L663_9STRA|nr:hypothetical protein As57867_016710 [Aphanomyces stellatus]VFT93532.1 Aste57867_16767 [Aphanomyces stellatus]